MTLYPTVPVAQAVAQAVVGMLLKFTSSMQTTFMLIILQQPFKTKSLFSLVFCCVLFHLFLKALQCSAWWNTDERANQCQRKKHEYNTTNREVGRECIFFSSIRFVKTQRQDMYVLALLNVLQYLRGQNETRLCTTYCSLYIIIREVTKQLHTSVCLSDA